MIAEEKADVLILTSLLDTLAETLPQDAALRLIQASGARAGRQMAMKYDFLPENKRPFFENFAELNQQAWFPTWEIEKLNAKGPTIEVVFKTIAGCGGENEISPPFRCEFMGHYLLGIFDTYMRRKGTITLCCHNKNDPHPIHGTGVCSLNWMQE